MAWHPQSDILQYCTVKLRVELQNNKQATGTGFFVNLDGFMVLVTNKHVIKDGISCKFDLRVMNSEKRPNDNENYEFIIDNFDEVCIPHPDPNIDLLIFDIYSFIYSGEKQINKKFFFRAIELFNWMKLPFLKAVEDIIMVGYPIGLSDDYNNLPLIRRGITATQPTKNYNGESEFLIDAACFPGSSGSPVFLYRPYNSNMREGPIEYTTILLGVLWGGPQYNAKGKVIVRPIPTSENGISSTRIPINLGYVIHAEKLKDFIPILKELYPELDEKDN